MTYKAEVPAAQYSAWLTRTAAQLYTQLPESAWEKRMVTAILDGMIRDKIPMSQARAMAFDGLNEKPAGLDPEPSTKLRLVD